jgi:DNA-binding NarL/FixJ family response regulator
MSVAAEIIRIVLVDDHMLVREGIREILTLEADLRVVAEAGDSAAAVEAVKLQQPDIVLLDVEIPGDEVTTTVRNIHVVSPASRVVILSMYDGPQLVRSLLGLDVKGYLLKSVTRLELVAAIRSASAADGRIVLSVSPESLWHAESASTLSARERSVLELVADAMSNVQVASRLGLTEATVKRHLRNIFVKLGAVSRIDAVNKAVAMSLIRPAQADEGSPSLTARRPSQYGGDGGRRPR